MASTSAASSANLSQAVQDLMKSSSQKVSATEAQADQFMTLLTTQMRYQDPLNPMDNAQMTSQLAQINTVKGLEKLNASIETLLSSYSSTMNMQAAALIGKNVLASGNSLSLQNGEAVAGINLDGSADNVVISIKNAAGLEVAQEALGSQKAGVMTFSWDGKDSNGNQLPAGDYTFSVAATQGSSKVTATPLAVGTVSALINGATGYQLEVGNLGKIAFSDIKEIF